MWNLLVVPVPNSDRNKQPAQSELNCMELLRGIPNHRPFRCTEIRKQSCEALYIHNQNKTAILKWIHPVTASPSKIVNRREILDKQQASHVWIVNTTMIVI